MTLDCFSEQSQGGATEPLGPGTYPLVTLKEVVGHAVISVDSEPDGAAGGVGAAHIRDISVSVRAREVPSSPF